MRIWVLLPFCYSFCLKWNYDAYVPFKDKKVCACVDLIEKKEKPPIPLTLRWSTGSQPEEKPRAE